ncbi:hypothetical protein CALCODRAFT_554364 [Calocera cornea HHB12733]|uniref:Extracellular membrane protein CFEM domain-containing protein n=1 Tax=Calocera cornea HHB12733 TaxID=1353952 RepID=A0A165HDP6_9BASI|nr:hypothetical protein CALCODRAFT_554364 [Calocera cornea HHB12733]
MQILSSSILLLVLSVAGAQARPRNVSMRSLSPVAKGLSARSPRLDTPPMFKRQEVCQSQCAGDASTLSAMSACVSSGTPNTESVCICQQMANLSSGCESCILNYDEITPADWAATCADASSLAGGATAITSAAAPATTSSGTCSSQCSSASDLSGAQALSACSESDTNCLCSAASTLSSACLTCVLTEADLTTTEFQSLCSASSAGTTAAIPAGSTTVSAALPAGTTSAVAAASSKAASGGSGTSAGGAGGSSAASSPSASTTAHSAAGKVALGGHGAIMTLFVVFVSGVMALL